MRIGPHDTDDRVLVVAEIGNNHEGDPEVARRLVEVAAEAGCDAVKLQVFTVEGFVRPSDRSRREQMARFRLADEVVVDLLDLARERGMATAATPLDGSSLDLVEPHVDALKIASGDNDFLPLLRRAGWGDRPVVVSTGLADVRVVAAAVEAVREGREGRPDDLALLHCVSAYPASPEAANLAAIGWLSERFGLPVGYSDHTLGVEVATMAVAAGARIVEKHVTLDHAFSEFRDHALSAEPDELRTMVAAIRRIEELLGEPCKAVQPEERPLLSVARRSIVARGDLPVGHVIRAEDLDWMRPRDGMEPGRETELIGRCTRAPIAAGEALLPEVVI